MVPRILGNPELSIANNNCDGKHNISIDQHGSSACSDLLGATDENADTRHVMIRCVTHDTIDGTHDEHAPLSTSLSTLDSIRSPLPFLHSSLHSLFNFAIPLPLHSQHSNHHSQSSLLHFRPFQSPHPTKTPIPPSTPDEAAKLTTVIKMAAPETPGGRGGRQAPSYCCSIQYTKLFPLIYNPLP